MKTLLTRTVLLVAFLAAPALPLLAQQSAPKKDEKTTTQEEKKPKVTEEMVVTARKREETVEEVPMSVAAPTESELRDRERAFIASSSGSPATTTRATTF